MQPREQPVIRGVELQRFADMEQSQRLHEQREDPPPVPKITAFFTYAQTRLQEEVMDEDRAHAAERIEGLMGEVDAAAHRYVLARIRHVRHHERMMVEGSAGGAATGTRLEVSAADQERRLAHEAYMDALLILVGNLRKSIAQSQKIDLKEVPPVEERFRDLFDRDNREKMARHAIDYCWYLITQQLGIPYAERT